MLSGSKPQVQQPALGVSDEVASRAIGFAEKYGTPLTPVIYEVWYTYCARSVRGINESLDLAMNTGQPISEDYLAGLYHEHLSARSMSDDLDTATGGLVNAMGTVSTAVDENMAQNSMFSGTLRSAKRSLVQGTSKQELAELIKKLHLANQEHLQAAQRLNVQLDKSRANVAKLKGDLIEARRTSNTDYVTGLPNRRLFDELLDKSIFEVRQKNQDLSVLLGVIDNLREVSDKWGLRTSDSIVRLFAEQLQTQLKSNQTAARFAGARFAILMPQGSNRDGFSLAEFARKKFKTMDWVSKESGEAIGTLSVSFGGAMLQPGDTGSSLIDRADVNLRRAQAEGMDRTIIS